ncbi:MAG: hypothetical protein B1H07_02445 [Campylobacteraceae bacterium 4484_166]|nr:MAG: hypothetical protein B1H07_02445 [Campylobacteraceae bacterium 4484_166]
MIEKLKLNIINFVFKISSSPVLYYDLLLANKRFNDGMLTKNLEIGVRLIHKRAYVVFFLLLHIVVIPLAYFSHILFAKVDCHLSIIVAIVFTSFVFSFFGVFKEWLFDAVLEKRIKDSWPVHFAFFSYEKYRFKVEKYFDEALKRDIQKKDIQRFIENQLSQDDK